MVSEAAVHPAMESLVELHHGSQEAESGSDNASFSILFFSSVWSLESVDSAICVQCGSSPLH